MNHFRFFSLILHLLLVSGNARSTTQVDPLKCYECWYCITGDIQVQTCKYPAMKTPHDNVELTSACMWLIANNPTAVGVDPNYPVIHRYCLNGIENDKMGCRKNNTDTSHFTACYCNNIDLCNNAYLKHRPVVI